MTTSATTYRLSKPSGRKKIPGSTLTYMQTRNRMRVFNLVHKELRKSGLSKAELADRIGKGQDRIAHILAAPGNWTLDTVSDLLFAINGYEVDYQVSSPLDKPPRNQNVPEWLAQASDKVKITDPTDIKVNLRIEPPKNDSVRPFTFAL